jgi:hypothetical protein
MLEVGAGRLRTGKSEFGHRDPRHPGRPIVKHPDRFEAAHVRHEDIDDHQVERRTVKGNKAGGMGSIAWIRESVDDSHFRPNSADCLPSEMFYRVDTVYGLVQSKSVLGLLHWRNPRGAGDVTTH